MIDKYGYEIHTIQSDEEMYPKTPTDVEMLLLRHKEDRERFRHSAWSIIKTAWCIALVLGGFWFFYFLLSLITAAAWEIMGKAVLTCILMFIAMLFYFTLKSARRGDI